METQTINQAVSRLEAMPKAKQQEIFDFIDFIYSRKNKDEEVKRNQLSEPKDFFESWQKWHTENKQFLDNDSSWADVRDKNDFGRDFSWDD